MFAWRTAGQKAAREFQNKSILPFHNKTERWKIFVFNSTMQNQFLNYWWTIMNIAVWKVKKDKLGLSKFLPVGFQRRKKKDNSVKFMLKTLENSFSSEGKSASKDLMCFKGTTEFFFLKEYNLMWQKWLNPNSPLIWSPPKLIQLQKN